MTIKKNTTQLFDDTKENKNIVDRLSRFFLFIWFLTIIFRSSADLFITIGAISLVLAIVARFNVKRRDEISIGGSVFGNLVVWVIAKIFYSHINDQVELYSLYLSVNQLLTIFLVILIIAWFVITDRGTTQELVFGLNPVLSSVVLNVWKIGVAILLLAAIDIFSDFKDIARIIFVLSALVDLLILYTAHEVGLDYNEMIMNPFELLPAIFKGPLQSIRWILLVIIFYLLNLVNLNSPGILLIIGLSVIIAVTGLSTSLTRSVLASGVVESKVKEGKVLLPVILNEIHQLKTDDFKQTAFVVKKETRIRKKNSIIRFRKGMTLLRVPFSSTIEERVGVFIVFIRKPAKEDSRHRKSRKFVYISHNHQIDRLNKKQPSINVEDSKPRGISISSIKTLSNDQWEYLLPSLELVDIELLAKQLGFKDIDEMNQDFLQATRDFFLFQEHFRARIKGIPAPVPTKSIYPTKLVNGSLKLPPELMERMKIISDQEIELIPGKDNYLFYARKKQLMDQNSKPKTEMGSK